MAVITGNEFVWAWASGIKKTVRVHWQKSEVQSMAVTIGIMAPIIIAHFLPANIALIGGLSLYLLAVCPLFYKVGQYISKPRRKISPVGGVEP